MAMLSSPLAAMQPPPCPTGRSWGFGHDNGESLSRKAASNSFGRSAKFNFADMAMNGMGKDYFSQPMGPARGSSPTASLAADLSANFYIDQSPQLPTPRRSLFTSGLFSNINRQAGATTPPIQCQRETATTPTIASSSPACGPDAMDIEMSPLPHKLPFAITTRQCIGSPGRQPLGSDGTMPPQRPTSVPSIEGRPSFADRKRSFLQRPSLSRTKCMSTSQIVPLQRENQLPSFRFAAGPSIQTSTAMTLDDAFVESPSQARTVFNSQLTLPPRPRMQAMHGNVVSRGNISGLVKNKSLQASAATRPRKQMRRTLSMFEHPADVMKTQAQDSASLDAVMDVEEVYQQRLPSFVPDEPSSIPRINQETMVRVLDGEFKDKYDNIMVVDCRFEYEYSGGHIDGAENYNDKQTLVRHLFDSCSSNTLLILHCEYSAHRAPLIAKYVREHDRSYNAAQYPRLSYPEMYILDGGYSAFFRNHRIRCFPQNYVEMEHKEHIDACERGLGRVRQRSKLSRAVTYAFGQDLPQIHGSPSRPCSSAAIEHDADVFLQRMHPRRSASG